jgi:hypothetical protein
VVRVPIYKEDHERKPDTFDLVSGGAKVLNSLSYLKTFVNIHTSMIVSNASLLVLITDRVFSQHLLNTPSTPVTPMPSIMSLVRRNGTYKQGEKKKNMVHKGRTSKHYLQKLRKYNVWFWFITYPFRCFKHETLFKCNTKINVYNLGCVLIN